MTVPEPGRATAPVWVSPAQQDADRAAAIADALASVEGVAAVSPAGAVRFDVRVGESTVEVHVVTHYGPSISDITASVATAVGPLLDGRTLQVVVDDILLPGEHLTEQVEPADPTP